jgi:putative ABC transport system substrate-binding protein
MMDRRVFLTTVAGLLAVPLAAEAQQSGRAPRIGFLAISPGLGQHLVAAFREGLRDRGWVEGQNVIIEYRWAGGGEEKYPTLLAELVGLKVDVIVTVSTTGALAAKRATAEIPIVFQMVSDPVASGLVASLARPGGNATGWSNILPETSGKLLELGGRAPRVPRRRPWKPDRSRQSTGVQGAERPGADVGVTLQSVEVPHTRDPRRRAYPSSLLVAGARNHRNRTA